MTPIRLNSINAPLLLKYLFGFLVLSLLSAYIIFQARVFIAGPQISLLEEQSPLQTNHAVTLSGMAENITEIAINGRLISTDENGYFQESVILENGYTIVEITAKDRYGRTTGLTREFVYTPLSLYVN